MILIGLQFLISGMANRYRVFTKKKLNRNSFFVIIS